MGAGEENQTKSTSSSAAATSAAPAPATAKAKANVRMESLGWLTESAVMPKKHKAIEGVGASSILELKAHLYRSQEQARNDKASNGNSQDFHRAKKKIQAHNLFSVKNSGVDSRARKDKLELKAENDGSKIYAALEKKAELYEKLARGEVSGEEEKEKYCVDFFQKSITGDEYEQPQSQDTRDAQENEDGETDDNEFLNSKPFGPGRTSVTVDSDEHKRFVREVHEEASQARHHNTTAKLRRQEQVGARREKLKQAYLKKQLEKLISARKTAAAPSSSADAANSEAPGS